MKAAALEFPIALASVACSVCGVEFAMPESYDRRRREDHKTFYCPNGHLQYYPQKPEAEALREQLAAEQERTLAAEQERDAARLERDRLQRRVKRGVCPCCKRSFMALRRHMATKHPDYPAENTA